MPGLKVVEPLTFLLRGVTGNKLTARGHIKLYVSLDGINLLEANTVVVVVDQSVFPGDLLTGLPTIYEQDTSIIPSELGAKYSYKFIPFRSLVSEVM